MPPPLLPGFVRSGVVNSLIQWGGRSHVLFAVLLSTPQVQVAGSHLRAFDSCHSHMLRKDSFHSLYATRRMMMNRVCEEYVWVRLRVTDHRCAKLLKLPHSTPLLKGETKVDVLTPLPPSPLRFRSIRWFGSSFWPGASQRCSLHTASWTSLHGSLIARSVACVSGHPVPAVRLVYAGRVPSLAHMVEVRRGGGRGSDSIIVWSPGCGRQ